MNIQVILYSNFIYWCFRSVCVKPLL